MDINAFYKKIKEFIPESQVLINEPMKNHTSFRIGGPADILIMPSKTDHIKIIMDMCKQWDMPIYIMGNGSNLLVRDGGMRGVVVKLADKFSNAEVCEGCIKAQSGILMSKLSRIALQNSLSGLEFACGIPGTLGGAVTMNAGAYGGEMKDIVENVEVLDREGNIYTISRDGLDYGYRTSIIQKNQLIALNVCTKLYPDDYSAIKDKMDDLTRRRRQKQPLSYPSAGSVFKRPPGYYAGKLIQDVGLKGARIGDAQVSEMHAGFIINLGNATAKDVIDLIHLIQDRVYEEFGVEMYPELRIVGEE